MKKLTACLLMMAFTLYLTVMYLPAWLGNVLVIEIVLTVLSAVLCMIFKYGLQVSLKIPVPVSEKGKKAAAYIHIKNKLPLAVPKVTVMAEVIKPGHKKAEKKRLTAAVEACGEVTVPLAMTCDLCGNIRINIKKVKVTDYFRWLSASKRVQAGGDISVLPRLLPAAVSVISNFRYFSGDSDVYADDRGGDDVSQIFEIRPYRAGDKMQKIHWKLSAKSDEMMVREYSDPVGYAIVIFLNLYTDGKPQEKSQDAAVEAAAAVSWTLLHLEYSHIVAWIGKNGQLVRYKLAQPSDIYDMLAAAVKAQPHGFKRPVSDLYNEKYGAASYHTLLEVNLKPEIILREDARWTLQADKLESDLLALNMEI